MDTVVIDVCTVLLCYVIDDTVQATPIITNSTIASKYPCESSSHPVCVKKLSNHESLAEWVYCGNNYRDVFDSD